MGNGLLEPSEVEECGEVGEELLDHSLFSVSLGRYSVGAPIVHPLPSCSRSRICPASRAERRTVQAVGLAPVVRNTPLD